MVSVAICDCPHCVDYFAFDLKLVERLSLYTHVTLRCPRCQKEVLLVTKRYEVIHSTDPEKYQSGAILKIEPCPRDFDSGSFRVDLRLRIAANRKRLI